MTRWTWGYLMWGAGWIGAFLLLELTGYWHKAPWPTLSETVWHSEHYQFAGPVVFATLVALIAHFLYHRPLWHSVMFGVLVAIGAHIANHTWP